MKTKVVVLFALSLLIHCASAAYAETEQSIYAAFGLSGDSIIHGTTDLNATTLAIEDFNRQSMGTKFKLVVENSGTSDKDSLSAVKRLVSLHKANIILGPTWLDSFQASIYFAKSARIFLLAPSASAAAYTKSKGDYPYVFSTWFPLDQGVAAIYKMLHADQKKRIVLLYDSDPYIVKVSEMLRKYKPASIEIVDDIQVPSSIDNFATLIAKLKTHNPDALFVNFGESRKILTFFQQKQKLNFTSPVYSQEFVEAAQHQKEFEDILGEVTYYYPEGADPSLIERYKQRFNSQPELNVGYAYDAAAILLDALAHGHNTPESLRQYLLSKEFPSTAYGTIRFDAAGNVVTKLKFTKRKAGKILGEL